MVGRHRSRFIPACAGNRVEVRSGSFLSPVHPRVCGEQSLAVAGIRELAGSSPRVRGTEALPPIVILYSRFIPACAGNSFLFRVGHRCSPVHPRVCGEQNRILWSDWEDFGSSPRVRGTGVFSCDGHRSFRFIPACAGNSGLFLFRVGHSPVHPRVCGEQTGKILPIPADSGSSPRVRGTGRRVPTLHSTRRFIPACAGNSLLKQSLYVRITVHPRVCGEQMGSAFVGAVDVGSSPRVRGTVIVLVGSLVIDRFIPACAGNRPWNIRRISPVPVHPRVCGEQRLTDFVTCPLAGSSPRVRGTGQGLPHDQFSGRFIPACAGNSKTSMMPVSVMTVHPRVCGEQYDDWIRVGLALGSSPRVRGTGNILPQQLQKLRFIPACAGNRMKGKHNGYNPTVHPRVCGEQGDRAKMPVEEYGSSPRVRGTAPKKQGLSLDIRFIPACAGNR